MKKSFWIGLIFLAILIAGVLAWRFLTPSGSRAVPGALSSVPSTDKLTAAKAEPLRIAGVGGYHLEDINLGDGAVPLIRIPLDTWGGYAALFAANGGSQPSKESVFYKQHRFAVELVREEKAQSQVDGFAAGRYPIIWSAMDGVPLLYDALKDDKRVIPQVLGLFDWSVGGDGIVVRDFIRKPQDLKGQTILTSSPSPYSFFLLWYLAQLEINPLDVKIVHVDDGQEALAVFKDNPGIAAWVTWTPFLTDVVEEGNPSNVKGTRLLITSKDANQLIADVFVARNDFVKEHPDMAKGLVAGILTGYDAFTANPAPTYAAMAAFYGLSGGASEAKGLLDEVHLASLPEAVMFFDPENPIGAHKLFYLSQEYYKLLGVLGADASYQADRVIAKGALETAEKSGRFNSQKNTIRDSFNRDASLDINDLEDRRMVLSNDLRLYFDAQKLDFDLNAETPEMRDNRRLLEKVADQNRVLGTTVVKLIGHLDTSRVEEFKAKGAQAYVEATAQAKLISKRRAEFVKKTLVTVYGLDPDRIITEGRGWDQPIDVKDPQANRRVEVQFLSYE